MKKEEWEAGKTRYAMFLAEKGEFACPYPWHEEERRLLREKADDLWQRMNRREGRKYLWEECSDFSRSRFLTESYQNVRAMALARHEAGAPYETAQLTEALEWLEAYAYHQGAEQADNWWDWQIGVPLALLDCCFLLREELGQERIERFCLQIEWFSGRQTLTNPIFTGANLVWVAMISAMCGLLTEEEEEIREAKEAALRVLRFSEQGDGFYRDGSFIQHQALAYTGGYGISFMDQMTRMMVLLRGTPYAFQKEEYGVLTYFLEHSFFPVIVKGHVMDMVCGREISRYFMKGNRAGKQLMDSMWRMHFCVDEVCGAWLLDTVSRWLSGEGERDSFVYFGHMDRAVCHRETYAAGLAMYSSRIQNYEAINDENRRGWHTGSGMLYLYGPVGDDFDGCYWCTADMEKLPGTTVIRGSHPAHLHVQSSSMVGGIGHGSVGAAAMEICEPGFHVKKSWFFFDHAIVCLGNDMRGEGRIWDTTLENRMMAADVDADAGGIQLEMEETGDGVRSLCYGLPDAGGKRGFYFLIPVPAGKERGLKVIHETRTGTWSQINGCSPCDTVYSADYLTIWMEHDMETESAPCYAYVIYPSVDQAWENREKDWELLSLTPQMHAVRMKEENRIAGVCWAEQGGCLDLGSEGSLLFSGPAVFMAKKDGDSWGMAARNPLRPRDQAAVEGRGEFSGLCPWKAEEKGR